MDTFLQFFLSIEHIWVLYFLLFCAGFVENIMPPVPGDTVMFFGAYLVAGQVLSFSWVYLSTTAGSVAGFIFLFLLSKNYGRDYFLEKNYSFFPSGSILKAEQLLSRHAYAAVLINRFLPGLRSVISISAGFIRLNTAWVLLLSFLSACVWNGIWIYAGYTVGNNWNAVKFHTAHMMKRYNETAGVIIAVIAVGAGVYLVVSYRRHKRKKKEKS